MTFIGELCAVGAAISNGTVGVLNRAGLNLGISHDEIAFIRAFGAVLVLSVLSLFRPSLRHQIWSLRKISGKIALCAFFGSFTLSAAETWAFYLAPIPVVSFLTYSSGIVTVILGVIFLKESITLAKLTSIVLVGFGVYHLFGGLGEVESHFWGAVLAVIGGLGYSFFLLTWRGFKIPGGLASLWWLLAFGSLFLSVPMLIKGPTVPPLAALPSLLLLTVLPTLGGFYLSSKALSHTEAGRVQLIETSEPVFASAFAILFYGEWLTFREWAGSLSVLAGIMILVLWRSPSLFPRESV